MELVTQKREIEKHMAHLDRIKRMSPHIDTSTPKTLGLKHLATRPKKQQLIDDRRQEIAKENRKLMENMAKILTESKASRANAGVKIRSINEIQRKHAVEKLNFENRLLFERLEKIVPVIKKEDFQREYDKNKAFHSRRRKHVPFGVVPLSKIVNRKPFKSHNDEGQSEPESSMYNQFKHVKNYYKNSNDDTARNYGDMGEEENDDDEDVDEGSRLSIITPSGVQSVSEFRRQLIASRKQQSQQEALLQEESVSNISKGKSFATLPSNFSHSLTHEDGNVSGTKFQWSHDPESL